MPYRQYTPAITLERAVAAAPVSVRSARRIPPWIVKHLVMKLDHGYDESKHPAARGDVASPLQWRCAFGHEFCDCPRLVLAGGHWCPVCVRDAAGYALQVERTPFLAQIENASNVLLTKS